MPVLRQAVEKARGVCESVLDRPLLTRREIVSQAIAQEHKGFGRQAHVADRTVAQVAAGHLKSEPPANQIQIVFLFIREATAGEMDRVVNFERPNLT